MRGLKGHRQVTYHTRNCILFKCFYEYQTLLSSVLASSSDTYYYHCPTFPLRLLPDGFQVLFAPLDLPAETDEPLERRELLGATEMGRNDKLAEGSHGTGTLPSRVGREKRLLSPQTDNRVALL